MANLQPMPAIAIPNLSAFGTEWHARGGRLSRTPPFSSIHLGEALDKAVAEAHAVMLGDIPIKRATRSSLLPPEGDDECVELGELRIVGGVRPQNFDVGFRPDGVRIAFDSKTLNDLESFGKNWNNMVNDLGTEAVTVHTRFPHAVVEFLVAIPAPVLRQHNQTSPFVSTLERIAQRVHPTDEPYLAEAISLVAWDPDTGNVLDLVAEGFVARADSPLLLQNFREQIETIYAKRYSGMPPHD